MELKQYDEATQLGKKLLAESGNSSVLRSTVRGLYALGQTEEATEVLEQGISSIGLDVNQLKTVISEQLGPKDIESITLTSFGGWANLGFFHVQRKESPAALVKVLDKTHSAPREIDFYKTILSTPL